MAAKRAVLDQPYPGLRYYEDHQADFFAGREKETIACTRLLADARVLILHGRSGCGKSSFLRAGVKPKLESADPGSGFASSRLGFEVVRSTIDPMTAFTTMLLGACDELVANRKKGYWKPKGAVEAPDLEEFKKSYDDRRGQMAKSARHAYRTLVDLSRLLKISPVFVIDQAEEVFTLREKKVREFDMEDDKDDKNAMEAELGTLSKRADEYFDFLALVSEKGASGARIVVSLRTEYKGQFDDRISATRRGVDRLRGYYLRDLDEDSLIAAIERPTIRKADWKSVKGDDPNKSDEAPFDRFGFSFAEGVAQNLARSLKRNDTVPEGGVLPTLQIACLRLWKQARQAAGQSKTFTIKDSQRLRIGTIDLQIQEYIAQQLEDACMKVRKWPDGHADAIEKWHGILYNQLVEVQADGRAVTGVASRQKLVAGADDAFGDHNCMAGIKKVIDELRRLETAVLVESESEEGLSLGHDSVALALNKWHLRYNRDDAKSRRMMMSEMAVAAKYKMDELYPEYNRPHEAEIVIHRDFHWDRQLPHFAAHKGFAKRLGIRFVVDRKNIDVTNKVADGGPRDWYELSKNLRTAAQTTHQGQNRPGGTKLVMAASDWHSFPFHRRKGEEESEEDFEEWARDQVWRWSDVLVTDLFVGNGLIGPQFAVDTSLESAKGLSGLQAEELGSLYERIIREALGKIVEVKGEVLCHDGLALQFLKRAAELVCGKDSAQYDYLNRRKNVKTVEGEPYSFAKDPLVTWFLEQDIADVERPRFIVGTAAARAIALQAGHFLYFGTSELTLVARSMINKIRQEESGKISKERRDLGRMIQQVIKHTTWQLGISPTQWNQGRNRALVLRLASIGYYTVEFVRTNADDFVRFIRDQINSYLADVEAAGSGGFRGMRMNRDSIHAAVQDCYTLLKFDEYGTEFYDLDSTTAYWTEHAEYDSKSIAGEIYNELSALRQRTVFNYETVSQMITWMRSRDVYDLENEHIKEAIGLKEIAWRNYRIFNFYDSARFMAEAALTLQREMETQEVR